MVINFPNNRRRELNGTVLKQAFTEWKVAYGLAVHGNYTFHLPLEEVQSRWNAAHDAEQRFEKILDTLSTIIKIPSWIHTLEVEIERLEEERELDRASNPGSNSRQITHLLASLRALVEEAKK